MINLLQKFDAILISNVANITYLASDFGFSEIEREAFLLITKRNKYLITDKRYTEAVKNKKLDFILIDTGVYKFLDQGIEEIIQKENITTLGIEENNLLVAEYKKIKNKIKIKNIDLAALRIIKTKEQISQIKKAGKITDNAFNYIIGQLKIDVSENEISTLLENFIRKNGAEISFKPIIAFGKNSAIPHHLSDQTTLKKNQIVLLDFGVKLNNYCTDMSRTIFFGKANEKFKRIYNTVLEAQKLSIERVNNKPKAEDLDKLARDFIIQSGFPSIPHALGHGVGLEVHEAPHISPKAEQIILNGMIFTIEPGIYIENYGGIRIEDMIIVRNNKAELIYSSTREIIEV